MKLSLIAIMATSLLGCSQGMDTEMWFGKVADKGHTDKPCSHVYCSGEVCTTDANGVSSCTCVAWSTYHNRDRWWGFSYDWDLNGTADRFYFDGDDQDDGEEGWAKSFQGKWVTLHECGDCWLPRGKQRVWDETDRGDSIAVPHSFENYLIVDPESLYLNETAYVPTQPLPDYPLAYNFHRFDSAVNVGTGMDEDTWNSYLAHWNTLLGNNQQVHVMAVATYDPDPLYANALEERWLLGKKNNAIFVFGLNKDDTIKWSRLISFSDLETLRRHARDDFQGLHINEQATADLVVTLVKDHYERDPMKDKEYLLRNTFWGRWGGWIMALLAIVAVGVGGVFIVGSGLASLGPGYYGVRRRF